MERPLAEAARGAAPSRAASFDPAAEPAVAPPRRHWPEYVMEAAELALFMLSACAFAVLLEHPLSPVRRSIESSLVRRGLMGLAMGGTAIAIVHSPLGRRSGAHFNPAVTLTFWRLGRIARVDALAYVAAQFVGGVMGAFAAGWLLGDAVSHASVRYVVTVPGPLGTPVAFAIECAMAFVLMTVVLRVSNDARTARLTGLCSGLLVASYITFLAPLSGMSMNPARSFGSALPAGVWTSLWIYFAAPVIGMILAAEFHRATRGATAVVCAKLIHDSSVRCIFCESRVTSAGDRHPNS